MCPVQKIPPIEIGGYTLTISEVIADDDAQCVATVVSKRGTRTEIARDWMMSWLAGTGNDLNGDGVPDAIVDAYSGGAHCCWTYSFISLGERLEVYMELKTGDVPITIDQRHPGHTYIRTWDGAFYYFDDLCGNCSPLPQITLELQGQRLSDVSINYPAEYDRDIAKARREFERQDDGEEFAALQSFKPELGEKYDSARSAALTVVLAYLYSGREQQAWGALDEMWPASDRARIKKLILETRAHGILSQIGSIERKTHSSPR
jgi:hypothetical protein